MQADKSASYKATGLLFIDAGQAAARYKTYTGVIKPGLLTFEHGCDISQTVASRRLAASQCNGLPPADRAA